MCNFSHFLKHLSACDIIYVKDFANNPIEKEPIEIPNLKQKSLVKRELCGVTLYKTNN
jgi:hypothetical protein